MPEERCWNPLAPPPNPSRRWSSAGRIQVDRPVRLLSLLQSDQSALSRKHSQAQLDGQTMIELDCCIDQHRQRQGRDGSGSIPRLHAGNDSLDPDRQEDNGFVNREKADR